MEREYDFAAPPSCLPRLRAGVVFRLRSSLGAHRREGGSFPLLRKHIPGHNLAFGRSLPDLDV